MSDLMKIDAAARAVGLNRHTLYKAVAKGLLQPYRCGRALRFDLDELRSWMREQATAKANGNSAEESK